MFSSRSRNHKAHAQVCDDSAPILLSRKLLECNPTEAQLHALMNFDNSGSVYSAGGFEILKRIQPKFIADVQRDPGIRSTLQMQFGYFGTEKPLILDGPFCSVMELKVPELPVVNSTNLLARIRASLKVLAVGRKLASRHFNVDLRNSWLVETTDGYPTDKHLFDEVRELVRTFAVENKIEVHLLGIGKSSDMDFLNELAQPGRPAQQLESVEDFARLFNWVRHSVKIINASVPHTQLEIPSLSGSLIPTQGL